jgi:hypothetical protein
MPNRAEEQQHLVEADDHIRRAEHALADLRAMVAAEQERGADTTRVRQLLATSEETLEQFRQHRAHIAQTIRDIDAGRL